jgi:hypothetical protein
MRRIRKMHPFFGAAARFTKKTLENVIIFLKKLVKKRLTHIMLWAIIQKHTRYCVFGRKLTTPQK